MEQLHSLVAALKREKTNVKPLTLCMLGNFSYFCCHLLIFSKLTFSKKSFRNPFREPNGLDPDQDRHSVISDLGPNCLQRLSAEDKSRARTELSLNLILLNKS